MPIPNRTNPYSIIDNDAQELLDKEEAKARTEAIRDNTKSFSQAFAEARRARLAGNGSDVFDYNGKKFLSYQQDDLNALDADKFEQLRNSYKWIKQSQKELAGNASNAKQENVNNVNMGKSTPYGDLSSLWNETQSKIAANANSTQTFPVFGNPNANKQMAVEQPIHGMNSPRNNKPANRHEMLSPRDYPQTKSFKKQFVFGNPSEKRTRYTAELPEITVSGERGLPSINELDMQDAVAQLINSQANYAKPSGDSQYELIDILKMLLNGNYK